MLMYMYIYDRRDEAIPQNHNEIFTLELSSLLNIPNQHIGGQVCVQ